MIDLAKIPAALAEGENWNVLKLDPNWIWTSEHNGEICGLLIAMEGHGLVFIWRVKMLPGAPHWAIGKLFRRFIRDIRKRGCVGYITFLNVTGQPVEESIARIALRAGALFVDPHTIVYGSVNAKHVGER
jgi:hypothetical protein